MKIRLVSKIVFVLAIFSAMLLHAQDSASVTGTVRDQSGATVANAQVTVSAADRGINRETTSNGDGEYSVAALPPGSYDIAVTAQGGSFITAVSNASSRINQCIEIRPAVTIPICKSSRVVRIMSPFG